MAPSQKLPAMTNSAIDFHSPTWRAIADKAQAQLDTLRVKNDSPALDAIRTAETRGRIAAWKELLAMADDKPAPVQETPAY